VWRRAPCVNLYGGEINIYTSMRRTPIRYYAHEVVYEVYIDKVLHP
jgi:hypothetical protein